MNVKNKRCIRNLSHKQLKASKTRNLIAVFADYFDNVAVYIAIHDCTFHQ